jgi:SAGA-associated factor 29
VKILDIDSLFRSAKSALDCIRDIRTLQSEIHFIKTSAENNNNKDRPKTAIRRGVLMNILQQAALTLPLWIGDIDQLPPQLCGCMPQDESYVSKSSDKGIWLLKVNCKARLIFSILILSRSKS